jgi:hypothetical protein
MENTKENMFEIWDELIFLLEELINKHPTNKEIKELFDIQKEKKSKVEINHSRNNWLSLDKNKSNNFLNENLEKELILKWEELVIEAYFYLQEARMQGGTIGHKVGPVWSFQKETKEKYQGEILQLKYFSKT